MRKLILMLIAASGFAANVGCMGADVAAIGALAHNYQYLPGEDGLNGRDGSNGQPGEAGDDGKSVEAVEIAITASRDYSPSTFSPQTYSLRAGVYELPQSLDLVQGHGGTGWVSLIVDGKRYCYQFNGRNNGDAGDQAIYAGAKLNPASECFVGMRSNEPLDILLPAAANAELAVNGGGCSSSCTLTVVESSIRGIAN